MVDILIIQLDENTEAERGYLTCSMSHGHWEVILEFKIRSCASALSITPKGPLWHPFITLWAGSGESTDLGNKAHILIWLWASQSSSLARFLFCATGCHSLRVFLAHTAGTPRTLHSIALVSPLGRATGSPPKQNCSFGRSSHAGPQPASTKHSLHPLEGTCCPQQPHRESTELWKCKGS